MYDRSRFRYVIVILCCLIVFVIGFFVMYNFFSKKDNTTPDKEKSIEKNTDTENKNTDTENKNTEKQNSTEEDNPNETKNQIEPKSTQSKLLSEIDLNSEPYYVENQEVQTATATEDTIKTYTKIVYQYYYELDDKLVENVTQPPYYLIDMNRSQLQDCYPDWEVQSFSCDKVVLLKSLAEKNEDGYFILGEKEGYICVFYQNGDIREVTQTPLTALPTSEQKKLRKGIKVYGEDNLIKMLEDFTS